MKNPTSCKVRTIWEVRYPNGAAVHCTNEQSARQLFAESQDAELVRMIIHDLEDPVYQVKVIKAKGRCQ